MCHSIARFAQTLHKQYRLTLLFVVLLVTGAVPPVTASRSTGYGNRSIGYAFSFHRLRQMNNLCIYINVLGGISTAL